MATDKKQIAPRDYTVLRLPCYHEGTWSGEAKAPCLDTINSSNDVNGPCTPLKAISEYVLATR